MIIVEFSVEMLSIERGSKVTLEFEMEQITLNILPTKTTQWKIKYTNKGLKALKKIQQVRLYICQIFHSCCNDTKYALIPPIRNAKRTPIPLRPVYDFPAAQHMNECQMHHSRFIIEKGNGHENKHVHVSNQPYVIIS